MEKAEKKKKKKHTGYRPDEFVKVVVPALRSVAWTPFNVSFDRVVCNFDNATNWGTNITTISLILLLSEETQTEMGALTDRLEDAIRKTGLPGSFCFCFCFFFFIIFSCI